MPRSKQRNLLISALRMCRRGFLATVLFSFVINMLLLTAPLYMLQVYDRVLNSRSVDTLIYLTLIALCAFLTLWALDVLRGRVMIAAGTWLEKSIGGEVLAANLALALESQRVSIQPLRDISQLRGFLSGSAIFPILDAPWTPIFLAAVFLLHPLLGWIGLFGAITILALALINELVTANLVRKAGVVSERAMEDAQSATRNADAVEAMGMAENLSSRWQQTMRHSLDDQARASRRGGLVASSSKLIRQILQIAILGTGAWLVLGSEMSPGGMIASSILIARALAPVEQAITSWRSAIAARAAYQRLRAVMDSAGRSAEPEPLPEPQGNLVVDGLSYAHPGEKVPMLKGIGFQMAAGESLGLIGPSASGKTTLARILVGNLRPQMGSARLDGADLASWDARDRGSHIGYLPQDIELFAGTVRENIARLGNGHIDAVYDAARLAGIHQDILRLPNGYETQIGTGGLALSGGQRQKLGLARAVYGRPKLVVLDEPNSNLDQPGESALLQAMQRLREIGSTIIIIAHRPAVLRHVDKILVLKQGSIDMMGPRDKVVGCITGAAPSKPGVRAMQSVG